MKKQPERTTATRNIIDFYLSGMISIIAKWITSEDGMSVEEFAQLVRRIIEGMNKGIYSLLKERSLCLKDLLVFGIM